MVHKRFIKKNGKVYGPYYYKNVRKNGKVRSIYLGQSKDGRTALVTLSFFIIVSLVLLAQLGVKSFAYGEYSNDTASLVIWDNTSTESLVPGTFKYSYNSEELSKKWNITFYANFSNSSIGSINGSCKIWFNYSTGFKDMANMVYDPSTGFHVFSRNFTYDGTHIFDINCTNSTVGTFNVTDTFFIINTAPELMEAATTGVGDQYLKPQTCYEDAACTYNFSANITEYDYNDRPISNFTMVDPLAWLSISSSGIITVSSTTSSQAGLYDKTILATDQDGASATAHYNVTVVAVNDAPSITDPGAQTCTQDVLCSFDIDSSDEEDGDDSSGLFNYSDNTSLFDIAIGTGEVSFTPTNEQVGNHTINITVNDSNGSMASLILSLKVLNTNDAPNFEYACDNELEQTEDTPFTCRINASDIDPEETLTFSANYTWFILNRSTITVVEGNASSLVTFTPNDTHVYQHWVKITVTDSASATNTTTINFSASNVNDYPMFFNLTGQNLSANVWFNYTVNATDDDNLTQFGDTINYFDNTSLFNINRTTGFIEFFPSNDDNGTHWVNISINDSTGALNSSVIYFNISVNYKPIINMSDYNESLTEGQLYTLNLSDNASDQDGDSYTFADNTSMFDVNTTTGIINFTANDSDVGTHWANISITDSKGASSSYIFNFTVYNENDGPVLNIISNVTDAVEGSRVLIVVNANDSDLDIPNTPEYLSFSDNTTLFNISKENSTSAYINFTPGYDQAGKYWINVSVNDSSGNTTYRLFFINITNISAPPVFSYVCDNNRNATEDTQFNCTINATDSDSGEELKFEANYSWFLMNNSNITVVGGVAETVVNFTPTQSEIGNYSINITVTDGYTQISSIINFSVIARNDPPNISSIPSQVAYSFAGFTLQVNATDEENDTVYFYDNTSLFDINLTTGLISFTADDSQLGTYWVNITAVDLNSSNSSILLNVSVYNNTAPSCSSLINPTRGIFASETTFTMIENTTTGQFVTTCSDPEGDTFSYNWYWNGTLNTTGSGESTLDLFVTFYDEGDWNITLRLNDTANRTASYYWNVTVNHSNAPPRFTGPILNYTAGWFEDNTETFDAAQYFSEIDSENLTYKWYWLTINQSFHEINTTDIYSKWGRQSGNWSVYNVSDEYMFNQSQSTGEAVNSYLRVTDILNITEFVVKIKMFDGGAAGVCFRANSSNCTTAQYAILNATDNRTYWYDQENGVVSTSNNSYPYNFNADTNYWLKVTAEGNQTDVYLSENGSTYYHVFRQNSSLIEEGRIGLYTYDTRAYFDDIVFRNPKIENVTVTSNASGSLTLVPEPDWYGANQIVIRVEDGNFTVDSNVFYLTVYEAEIQPVVQIQTTMTSSTSTSYRTQIAAMTLIVPSLVSLEPMGTTLVPIILNNTGELPLSIIDILAMTNVSDLHLTLDDTNFLELAVGERLETQLEIRAGMLVPQRYTIKINADSQTPSLHEVAEIIVDVRERDAALITQIREQIQFTRDLFLQNPECMELSEFIDEAERLLELRQFDRSLELLNQANQGCKDFIAREKEVKEEIKKPSFFKRYYKTIIMEVAALLLIMLLLMYYFKRRSYATPMK